jgi:uncharacterized protein
VRIVLDTNVVVSGLLSEAGTPAQVVDLCISGDIELVVDQRIVSEYRMVLNRPTLRLDPGDVKDFLRLTDYAEHVVSAPLAFSLPDPTDEPFLEVAIASGADALVTGNGKHFRPPKGRLAIAVVSPRRFLETLAGR